MALAMLCCRRRPPLLTAAAAARQGASGDKARFLRCYALYLAGEKRKNEELVEVASPMVRLRRACTHCTLSPDAHLFCVRKGRSNDVVNQELGRLEAELAPLFAARQLCPFSSYLYGLVLTERERKAEARVALAHAANEYPCHWGAWLALQALCPDAATAAGLGLRPVRSRCTDMLFALRALS
jgi:anaphase-promoting complex subunit 8